MSNLKGFKNCNIYLEGQGIVKASLSVEEGKVKSLEACDGALELDEKYINNFEENFTSFIDQYYGEYYNFND